MCPKGAWSQMSPTARGSSGRRSPKPRMTCEPATCAQASIAAPCPTATRRLTVWCLIHPTCTLPAEPRTKINQNFEHYYSNNRTENSAKKYHDAVLDLYFK